MIVKTKFKTNTRFVLFGQLFEKEKEYLIHVGNLNQQDELNYCIEQNFLEIVDVQRVFANKEEEKEFLEIQKQIEDDNKKADDELKKKIVSNSLKLKSKIKTK